MMAEEGAEHPSASLHSLPCESDCFRDTVISCSENSATVIDMCVKSEPEDQHISRPQYCTEDVQGFGAETMGSGLHLDIDHIKSEIVTVKIKEDSTDLQLQYNSAEGFVPPSEHLHFSTCVLSKQYKSETVEVKIEQKCQLQVRSCMEEDLNEAAYYSIKEECVDVHVNELSSTPSLYVKHKSETGVKAEHSPCKVTSNTDSIANEAEGDLLKKNSVTQENSLIIAGENCCRQWGAHLSQTCQVVHSVEKPYKCNECGKSFSQGGTLKQHQLVHSGEKPHKCSGCGKSFSRSSNLKQHERIHTGEKPYKCSQCGKNFSQRSALQLHQAVHSGEKPYKCSECGKSFTRGGHLKEHQLIHSSEKQYKCSECGKCFSQGGLLKTHQRVHSGEKPYKCSECGKSFSRSSNLKPHQRIHTGEKPYKCLQCGKGFCQRGALQLHQVVHSGVKPYKCSECGKSFTRGRHLKDHQLLHCSEKQYKCCKCGKSFSQRHLLKTHLCVHPGEKFECV